MGPAWGTAKAVHPPSGQGYPGWFTRSERTGENLAAEAGPSILHRAWAPSRTEAYWVLILPLALVARTDSTGRAARWRKWR